MTANASVPEVSPWILLLTTTLAVAAAAVLSFYSQKSSRLPERAGNNEALDGEDSDDEELPVRTRGRLEFSNSALCR